MGHNTLQPGATATYIAARPNTAWAAVGDNVLRLIQWRGGLIASSTVFPGYVYDLYRHAFPAQGSLDTWDAVRLSEDYANIDDLDAAQDLANQAFILTREQAYLAWLQECLAGLFRGMLHTLPEVPAEQVNAYLAQANRLQAQLLTSTDRVAWVFRALDLLVIAATFYLQAQRTPAFVDIARIANWLDGLVAWYIELHEFAGAHTGGIT